MDVMYLTRHVVAGHATCQSPIGSYRLLGGNMLTRGKLTRDIFRSDGPRFYRALIGRPTNMRDLKKRLRTGREFVDTWHADTWHILIGRSTFTEPEPATINCENDKL